MATRYLHVQLINPLSVLNENFVGFDSILCESPSVNYDETTGEVIINSVGAYYVDWWVNTGSALTTKGVSFGIDISGDRRIKADAPFKSGRLNGNGIIEVKDIPTKIKLINLTGVTVQLSTLVSVVANLVIYCIEGEIGPQGDRGATGPQGLQGVTGPIGAQGVTGHPGEQGIQGPTGPMGEQGVKGSTGPTGGQGIPGPQGRDGLIGPTGPTGPIGQQGPAGPVG